MAAKLASYFLIGGLEASTGLEADESCSNLTDNPLERAYKPAILRHLPDTNSWSNYNPDALSRLILPNGLRFCTDKEIRTLEPKSHSFVLTKEDGEKNFGVSLIFYEEVKDINICHALHTLQKMYTTEVEVVGGASSIRRTRNEQRPRSSQKPDQRGERSRSLPRHYQQSRLSSSTMDLSEASYDYRKSVLYVTKAIALILNEPLVFAAEKVLTTMQKYVCKHDYDVNILESLVCNLLYDIPLPSPGRSVRFWCLGEVVMLSMPKVPVELHQFDYNLLEFFDMLGVENAVKLLVIVLLEHQVLVYSSEFDKLMLVCESITTLMYPFKWPHVYVPILPPSLENFLDAPVPYIMGLLRPTTDVELYKHGSVGILDIDHGELSLPEELPEFPYEAEFIREIENAILKYGGREGVTLLKEHAIEQREVLESSMNQNLSAISIPIAKRFGSRDGLDDSTDTMEQLNQMISKFESLSSKPNSASKKAVGNNTAATLERLRLNNALREVFANRFCHIFLSYEHFVILQQDIEDDFTPDGLDKESTMNFDKISFLSDQNHAHLPFLSSFLETQTFSTFIDEAIARMSSDVLVETPFERRLIAIKEKFGESLVRTPTYTFCETIEATDEVMATRLRKVELTVTPQKSTNHPSSKNLLEAGIFPLFDPSKFKAKSEDNRNKAVFVKGDRTSKSIDVVLATNTATKMSLLNASPASIAETNWNFVNQLLREAKTKTKRILLEKLGSEAVEWGHGDTMVFTGSEENMLVASICDLCERIWSHGLQSHQRKSALWHYLYKFGRTNEKLLRFKGTLGVQAYCIPLINSKPYILPDHSRPIQVVIDPKVRKNSFDSEIMAVMHNVATMHEIKTEIGYARAWIRLALERKKLSDYLHVLVNDGNLLKTLYKRYAFLRCEDEREQCMHYLQTLNTVDFSCFTNAYSKSSMLYQVLIFPSQKSAGASVTSANVWLHVVGSLGETKSLLNLPRGVIHFSFWAKNLGIITSLRIGHDNAGNNPNWLIEHVVIKNEFTGQAYKFVCGRWLGTGIDDGSNERYMVGYPVSNDTSMASLVTTCANSPEYTLPVTQLKSTSNRDADQEVMDEEVTELQTMLGDAINKIVKFHHKSLNEKLSFAHLMCGQFGLVHAMLYIFSYGYKSARLFGRNLSVWDFFLKVTMDFNQSLPHLYTTSSNSNQNSPHPSPRRGHYTLESPKRLQGLTMSSLLDSPKRTLGAGGVSPNIPQGATLSRSNQFRRMYTRLITRIETTCSRLGKDDKFQLFICLAVHDRLLGRIVTDLTKAVAAKQLYEDYAFFRDQTLVTFLSHILKALDDISVPVDPAMKKTLEQHQIFK